MLIMYKIFTFFVYYITFPLLYVLYRTGSRKWGDRLGYYNKSIKDARKNCEIWLHASSMGEVKVLAIIINELKKLNRSLRLHVSVMTEAGYDRAREIFADDASVSYLPLDYTAPIKRFLKIINPDAAVFIETEIWPNIICELGRRNIPVFLANGRLSEQACRRYRWFRSGLKRIFDYYKLIMVQSRSDEDRYLKIGADNNRVKVMGSLKFDAPVNILPSEKRESIKKYLPFDGNAKLFIAGSTRDGEEELILDTFKRLLSDFENIRLILAPRHLNRLDDVSRLIEKQQLSYGRYSQLEKRPDKTKVLLIDKLGVLNDLYAISDIAFVGGTLVDIGGQNILEPVWVGVPVLYGPSIFNVRDSSEYIIKDGYGEMVHDTDELYRKLKLFVSGGNNYKRKNPDDNEPTRAFQTARIILGGIQSDAKNLAENNN